LLSKNRSAKAGKSAGKIRVIAEELSQNKSDVFFMLSGINLDKKDLFGKSDPFLKISKLRDGRYILVHKVFI
jgi:hypothetical protein